MRTRTTVNCLINKYNTYIWITHSLDTWIPHIWLINFINGNNGDPTTELSSPSLSATMRCTDLRDVRCSVCRALSHSIYQVVSCDQAVAQRRVDGHTHVAGSCRQIMPRNAASTGTDVLLHTDKTHPRGPAVWHVYMFVNNCGWNLQN